jgi:hypothetical protein
MAEKSELELALETLNNALGDVTPYRLVILNPAEIVPLDKNAHFMPKRIYDQLRDNIKQNGNLSSLPFLWKRPDGKYECLSGNHRVATSVEAGVKQILCLYTDAELTKSERIAIQLSHNSLVGQDDTTLLKELWNEIESLDAKIYSGLDEKILETLPEASIIALRETGLKLEELRLLFVSPEIRYIEDLVKRLSTSKTTLVADLEHWDKFFDALLAFKENAMVVNSSIAILKICEIVEEWTATHEVQHEQSTDTDTPKTGRNSRPKKESSG